MNPIFPELPHPLGVYTLVRLLESRENGDLYEATQSHVERAVVVEVMRPGATPEEEARFIDSARMRVVADSLPGVSQVLESLKADDLWFMTQEKPLGKSLAEIAEAKEQLSVRDICRIIEATATMYDLCIRAGLATIPLSPASIYLDAEGTPHFLSPVSSGSANPATQPEEQRALAAALLPVHPEGVPGQNRVLTLISWLRHGYEGQMVEWSAIAASAHVVQEQLGVDHEEEEEEGPSDAAQQRHRRKQRKKLLKMAGYGLLLVGLVLGGIGLGCIIPYKRTDSNPVRHHHQVFVQHRRHALGIADAPVTGADYGRFLSAWESMNAETRERISPGRTSDDEHRPSDWENQSPDKPVTGVSYEDAMAYARYTGAELPTAAQLQAVLSVAPGKNLQEWVRSEQGNLPASLKGESSAVLISQNEPNEPHLTNNRRFRAANTTFRIIPPPAR